MTTAIAVCLEGGDGGGSVCVCMYMCLCVMKIPTKCWTEAQGNWAMDSVFSLEANTIWAPVWCGNDIVWVGLAQIPFCHASEIATKLQNC